MIWLGYFAIGLLVTVGAWLFDNGRDPSPLGAYLGKLILWPFVVCLFLAWALCEVKVPTRVVIAERRRRAADRRERPSEVTPE